MTEQPHETPGFQHAAEFTIVLTFVVAGGKLDSDPAALQLLPDLMASR